MRDRGSFACAALGLLLCAGGGAIIMACSDADTASTTTTTTDAGTAPSDERDGASEVKDSGTLPEAAADAQADAGPSFTAQVGSTGWIQINDGAIFADFYEDDAILRATNAPACVLHVRSFTKPISPAGNVRVATMAKSDAGATAPIVLKPNIMPAQGEKPNEYLFFGDVFPAGADVTVQVEMSSTQSFPALGVQALPSPPSSTVTVSAPKKVPLIKIGSVQPFDLTWTAPPKAKPEHRLILGIVVMSRVGPGAPRLGDLRCGFPLTAGSASVPANLLAEMKSRLGGKSNGFTYIEAGGQREVKAGTASYVIEVKGINTTTFGSDLVETELD